MGECGFGPDRRGEPAVSGRIILKIPESEMAPGMARKYADKAFYFMMMDASEGETDFHLVGKNVFRPGTERPKPDELLVDRDAVMKILHGRKGWL